MNTRIGTYVTQTIRKEAYKAYIPPPLPPAPPLDLTLLYTNLEHTTHAIGELNSILHAIPNTVLFVYMYVRKEALFSSQIEGTQSSFSDLILFENHQNPTVSLEDVEEVSNYIQAITYGLDRLKKGFPLSLRLIREIHGVLLDGGRGSHKQPGEFRRTQNWIGGTNPSNAIFVPPPPETLMTCLDDFEKFLHEEKTPLPFLIKLGLIHAQFETIHPFLDGNGRLGRLLITILLCEKGLLVEPVLYFSLYLKRNRQLYYELLQEVRTQGRWEVWLEFFLKGLAYAAKDALLTAQQMNTLFEDDLEKINKLGRARFSCIEVFEYLKKLPQVTVPLLTQNIQLTAPTTRAALTHLLNLGIVEEVSHKMRDKVYIYKSYLRLLEKDAKPLK